MNIPQYVSPFTTKEHFYFFYFGMSTNTASVNMVGHILWGTNACLSVGSVHTAWKCWIQRWYQFIFPLVVGFPGGAAGNESANARDTGLIPGTGRSPGGGNGNPLQYFCLEHSVDRGASWARVRGVAESWTQLSTAQPPQCGWAPAALHLELAVFFFCHPSENIIVHHYGFNLHFSFKKWFSTFLLELSIQNLSLAQEEGKSWKGRSGFYWFIVLYPFWIWILCLTYIEYTPNIFLSTVCLAFSLSWQSFMIKRHFKLWSNSMYPFCHLWLISMEFK